MNPVNLVRSSYQSTLDAYRIRSEASRLACANTYFSAHRITRVDQLPSTKAESSDRNDQDQVRNRRN
jgi:hypothetical protein